MVFVFLVVVVMASIEAPPRGERLRRCRPACFGGRFSGAVRFITRAGDGEPRTTPGTTENGEEPDEPSGPRAG